MQSMDGGKAGSAIENSIRSDTRAQDSIKEAPVATIGMTPWWSKRRNKLILIVLFCVVVGVVVMLVAMEGLDRSNAGESGDDSLLEGRDACDHERGDNFPFNSLDSLTYDVLFRQNFESSDWNANCPSLIRVQDYYSKGVQYGHILKVSYPPTDRGSSRIQKYFNLVDQVDSATLSFDMKLHNSFEFIKGGKMHGLGGGTATTGCGPIDPNGWSVRMMWRRKGAAELYIYHQDRNDKCGDSFIRDNFKFERGRWYRIDLQVQMNSAPIANDGKALLYINGDKLIEVERLKLSGNAAVHVDKFMFSTFYGGSDSSWSPNNTTHVYFDNFSVHRGLKVTGVPGTVCEIFLQGIYNPSTMRCEQI